ncbi:MAG TPA: NAD(P)H-binding protein [Lysobacter sp.]
MHEPHGSTPAATVLVLGGSGFIGRHAVAALEARGCRVVIGSRFPQRRLRRATDSRAEYRPIRLERLLDPTDWHEALRGCDVVINCVGILRQRGRETYDRIHHRAPAALAAACRVRGLRLIHVSALGLDPGARSGFLRSKLDGEAALRASGADWRIVRPSLLDGDGGFGARWIRRVARWPLHVLPADALGRIAALDVGDLGEAIARLALSTEPGEDREYDLGGLHARTLAEQLAAMRALHTDKPALQLAIPAWLARLASHACDLLHVTPYSFGHWELLRRDNCPRHNRLSELLGRAPREIGRTPMPIPAPLGQPGAIV